MQPADYWFKPKRYGLGARPVTWQGWAVSYAYLGLVLSLFWCFVAARAGEVSTGVLLLWFLLVGIATLLFMRFARSKTEGEWRWRWGGRE
jgi:hypothetical protein